MIEKKRCQDCYKKSGCVPLKISQDFLKKFPSDLNKEERQRLTHISKLILKLVAQDKGKKAKA